MKSMQKHGKRRAAYTIASIAGMIALSGIRTTSVSAQSAAAASRLELIQISAQDTAPAETIKTRMLENRIQLDPSVRAEDVSGKDSRIEMTGFNRTRTGLQTVCAQIYLDNGKDSSLRSSFTEKTTILVKRENTPQIVLKSNQVTVNNGDAFNPFSYISYLNDDSRFLPAVKVQGKVNMDEDGDYKVRYTAVDLGGNEAYADLKVSVRTPEEVIQAREEEERLAREEAERAAAEEASRLEAERIAQEQAEEAERARLAAINSIEYSTAAGSATGSAIAGSARAWSGVGYYVWGGANPATGADCSGFTQYIFSQYGISLPHNNLAQASAGYQVSAAEALPGDIVVWDNHVGIYTGGGYYVSAMSPSLGIIEIPISASSGSGAYWGIYRIPGVN